MKRLVACVLLVSSLLAAKEEKRIRPRGFEASFVESYSPTEVTIKATGMGDNPEIADADVLRVALDFVLFKWTDRMVTEEEEKKGMDPVLDELYREPRPYLSWIADKVTATRKLADGQYAITRMVRVNKGALNELLVRKGVVASREDLTEAVGNPVIMVVPDAPKGQSPLEVFDRNRLAQQTSGVIESYLTARQYEVQIPRAADNLNSQVDMIGTVKGFEEDVAYKIALTSGSDVFITFAGQVDNTQGGRKASLVVKAFESTTGRALGTETGYSQTRPNTTDEALAEEAASDAIDKVLQRVSNYWKADARKGLRYKVVLKVTGKFDEATAEKIKDGVEDLVESEFPGSKQNVLTDKTMDYTILAPRAKYKTSSNVSRALRSKLELPGVKVKETIRNRKFLLLEVTKG
jgi:hypothetical protein